MGDSLSERQQIEERYHDRKYGSYSPKASYREISAYKYFRKFRQDVNNLRILDYGCGDGWLSIDLVKAGAAEVYGIDISTKLIEKAHDLAKKKGFIKNIHFMKMPGENLTFSDNYFDLCLGSAILHHTDLDLAIKNIFRVLKPGGKAIFIEPMNQNIFLKIWRLITPWRRSPAEKALVNTDLRFIESVFPKAKYNFFILTSIFTEGLLLVIPNSKFIILMSKWLENFDNKLLKRFPSLGKYCAIVVLELIKE
jgi:ubiquinone/menaquinone biosynthesis C-methylase UbiE